MRDAGYDDDICGGITAASCIIGPLVPPSIAMIIYGVIANESIAKLFVAGFVPGVLLTIALMMMNYAIAKNVIILELLEPLYSNVVMRLKSDLGNFDANFNYRRNFSGLFTPTEAAVIAAAYSIIIGMFVYRELTLRMVFKSCIEAMAITGVTALMVMTVTFFLVI